MQKLSYYRQKFSGSRAFTQPANFFDVRASDGEKIRGAYLESGESNPRLAFLVVHGLLANHRAHGLLEFAEALTRFGPVWSIDLRGHGLSSGECTLGNREALDVAAATEAVRRETSLPVVGIGFSMGAAAVVRSAALFERLDFVVAVSGPAQWNGRRRGAARRTRLLWRVPGGKTALRSLTGVRLARKWIDCESPASVAGKIAPAPLLVVQGTDDQFFPPEEGRVLYDEARDPKSMWIIEGGGHAEGLFYEAGSQVNRVRVEGFVGQLHDRISRMVSKR